MHAGFSHFDGSRRENFLSALLLLLMDADNEIRSTMAQLVRARAGLQEGFTLRDCGREARLTTAEDGSYRRSDLWLAFEDGTVLVEVKTHAYWDAATVADQMTDQANGKRLALTGQKILGAVLLAPRELKTSSTKFIGWSEVIQQLRPHCGRSPFIALAVMHLESFVERPIGLERGSIADMKRAAQVVACLREFLHSCVYGIDGSCKVDRLYLTPGDGEPLTWSGWAWHGLSVPFEWKGQRFRLGLYEYDAAPVGQEEATKHPWLEVYRADTNEPIVSFDFSPASLAPMALDAERERFIKEWSAWAKA